MNRKSFLVLDTNIWYTTLLLSTPAGAAVIYSLSQFKRKLALPEVIEEEIKKQAYKRGTEAVLEIQKNYRIIEQLMGERDNYQLPSNDEFVARVDSRLIELEQFIHKTEFTLSHAKSALKRVLEKTPPNDRSQQFKDSAIWESLLELAKEADVYFVTADKAFFKNSEPSKGMASNLLEDCKNVSGTICLYYELSDYLGAIKKDEPPFNKRIVIDKINQSIMVKLSKMAVEKGYILGDISKAEVQAFLTENHELIALEFEINYSVSEVLIHESGVVTEATLIVKGNCGYKIANDDVSDIEFDNINMVSKEGERIPSYGLHVLRAGINTCGRTTIPYRLKTELS
jgi:flagellar biosynthesis chaperone FliJ